MRPIDDDVMAGQLNTVTEDDNKTVLFLGEAKKIVHKLVSQQPTIDAVPVVRCYECKHQEYCFSQIGFWSRTTFWNKTTTNITNWIFAVTEKGRNNG